MISRILRIAANRVRSAAGAIDLASIMVGVLVMAIIGGVISASVFVVIPWAQDNAARSSLEAVRTAQSLSKVQDSRFADFADLVTDGALSETDSLGTITDVDGTCYVAASKSQTGTTFYATSKNPNSVSDEAGTPDTSWCANARSTFDDRSVNYASDPAATRYAAIGSRSGEWQTNRWLGREGLGSYSLVSGAADGPGSLGTYARKTWSKSPLDNGDTGFQNAGGGTVNNSGPLGIPVTAGEKITVSGWLRPSAGGKFMMMRMQARNDAFNILAWGTGPGVWSEAGKWTRIQATMTVPAGATNLSIETDVVSKSGDTLWQPGDTLDGTGLMIERSSTASVYSDGDTPGWSWTDTPGASSSTGYPYTLHSVAGEPVIEQASVAPGTVIPFAPESALSVYTIQQDASPGDATGFWQVENGQGWRAGRLMGTNPTLVEVAAVATGTGSMTVTQYAYVAKSTQHIYAATIQVSPTTRTQIMADGTTMRSSTATTPSQSQIAKIIVGKRDGNINAGLATTVIIGFTAAHDEETMRSVSKWLGEKYGLPVG